LDKERFLAMAPIYYAMAISSYWKTSIGAITREALQARFDVGDDSSLLENDVLFDKAVEWLVERDWRGWTCSPEKTALRFINGMASDRTRVGSTAR